MSLMRLLTAGRSLVGMPHGAVRYRMSDPRAMPKFVRTEGSGSSAASVMAGTSIRSVVGQAGAPGPAKGKATEIGKRSVPVRSSTEPASGGGCGERRGIGNGTADPDGTNRKLDAAASAGKQGCAFVRSKAQGIWNRWLEGFGRWLGKRRAQPSNPAVAPFARAPVQGELSLEKVKVVRNDLSDSDVEIVPSRETRKAKTEPLVASPAPVAENAVVGATS
jgi:hypothetical protein